jgi:glutathione synthase/RimK-type ligase-like ATP-grasp enzyme
VSADRPRRVAFVTRLERPALTADDALAVEPCAARGLDVTAAPWDDDGVDWASFDAVVLRSCWDYHLRPARFLAWLRSLARARLTVLNPPAVCAWNMRKSYLLFLERRGVPVPPTVLVRRGGTVDVAALAARFGGPLIVKPAIGAAGWRLFRLDTGDGAALARLRALLRRRSVLLQPWLPEIERAGEWSLVFFEGEYHHAAWKRAAAGDFRVHEEYGGSVDTAEPPATVRATAIAAVRALDRALPYARVDVVETAAGPRVSELELIEPELFLRCDPAAPHRFAEVIDRRLRVREPIIPP